MHMIKLEGHKQQAVNDEVGNTLYDLFNDLSKAIVVKPVDNLLPFYIALVKQKYNCNNSPIKWLTGVIKPT